MRVLRGDEGVNAQQQAYAQLGQNLHVFVYNAVKQAGQQNRPWKSADEVLEIAQNAVQDTLLKIFEQRLYEAYTGKEGAQFITYMRTIALNRAIDLMRREWRFDFIALPDEAIDDSVTDITLPPLDDPGSPNPMVTQEKNALWEDVRRCVEALDKQRRLVFVWIADQELAVQEIARRLNKTENAIHQLYYHARKGICTCLIEKGWDIGDVGRLYGTPTA